MKLNLSNAKTNNSIQNKVNSILALNDSETNEKETKKMKLNLSNAKTKLQLKKTDSIIESNQNLTIDKFDRIEKLSKSIDSIENTFIEFLKSQNQSITIVNGFTKKIDSRFIRSRSILSGTV